MATDEDTVKTSFVFKTRINWLNKRVLNIEVLITIISQHQFNQFIFHIESGHSQTGFTFVNATTVSIQPHVTSPESCAKNKIKCKPIGFARGIYKFPHLTRDWVFIDWMGHSKNVICD